MGEVVDEIGLSGGADVGDVLSHGLAWCPEYGAMEWMELLVQSVPLAILRDDSRRPKIPVPRTGDVCAYKESKQTPFAEY